MHEDFMPPKMRTPTGFFVLGLSLVVAACDTASSGSQLQKPANTSKAAGAFYQANHIQAICAKKDGHSMSWCMGFIAGVADTANESARASGTCVFKLPRNIDPFTLRGLVLVDLEWHGTSEEQSGAGAVTDALRRLYPC
jgi:hypothetical protein